MPRFMKRGGSGIVRRLKIPAASRRERGHPAAHPIRGSAPEPGVIPRSEGSAPDRIWLASYPRSGSTLLRLMLWHGFALPSTSVYPRDLGGNAALAREVGHFECGAAVPDGSAEGPLLVKTHGPPPDSGAAIYLVRDGREASVSLWRFKGRQDSLRAVIGGVLPAGTWAAHVRAWDPLARPDTLLLRYEEMVSDPPSALESIGTFLGRPVRSTRLPGRAALAALDGRWVCAVPSDWSRDASPRDGRLFDAVNGGALATLGYGGRHQCRSSPRTCCELAYWRMVRMWRGGGSGAAGRPAA